MSERTYPFFDHLTVKEARNAGTKPNPHGGELVKWYCDFTDSNGKPVDDCYWQRKAGSDVVVGDTVYGKVDKTDYGIRFYKEKEPDGAGSSSAGSSNFKSGGGGKSPDQQASIVRQHSQEMALRALAIVAAHTPPGTEPPTTANLRKELPDWIDFFAEDANAAQAASGAGGSASSDASPPPAPSQTPEVQATHEALTHGFESAGQDWSIAKLLTDWILETQTVEKQDEIVAALKDEGRRDKCFGWAKGEYEKKHGALPRVSQGGDDDIPF